jgi:FtsP/CotA-like multicopper oxidase with cupredoxin domain
MAVRRARFPLTLGARPRSSRMELTLSKQPMVRPTISMSRRQVILRGAALGAAIAAPGLFALSRGASGRSNHMSAHGLGAIGVPRAPFQRDAPLVEPEVRRSVNGDLSTTLRVGYAYKDIGGYRLSLRTYEGNIPGPTLRLQPGDTLRLKLVNMLPPNPDSMPVNRMLPHHFNTTNLHLHGGHVDPGGLSDNIFRSMLPGQTYDITIRIPSDHTRGTYWYHPHHHGSADIQLTGGMAGVVIIEGDFDDIPEVGAARERVLVLNEVLFDHRGMLETYDTVWPEAVPRFLSINGQREPAIRMRPGEVQRWRVVHAGHENNLNLRLAGHDFSVIAYDGIRLDEVDRHKDLLMVPGQRADVLVKAGSPGVYALAAVPYDQGYPSPTGPLATLVVDGEPIAMALPAGLGSPPLPTIRDAEITNRRRLWLSAIEPEFPPAANYHEFAFLICGQRFDPERVDQSIPLGAVEEWTIDNEHTDDHIFHIHTNPFELVAVNGQKLVKPLWRDSVVVPRKGGIVFRSRFLDFTGRFVLHCHMMNHEELGMMQVVEVVS